MKILSNSVECSSPPARENSSVLSFSSSSLVFFVGYPYVVAPTTLMLASAWQEFFDSPNDQNAPLIFLFDGGSI